MVGQKFYYKDLYFQRILKQIWDAAPHNQLYLIHLTETNWKSICGAKTVVILADTCTKEGENLMEGCKKTCCDNCEEFLHTLVGTATRGKH
jgi:hypothetical protein